MNESDEEGRRSDLERQVRCLKRWNIVLIALVVVGVLVACAIVVFVAMIIEGLDFDG
jgi:flagellar basal body-associated protein FliL